MPLQATSGAASYDAFGGGVPAVPNYIEDVFSTYLYTGNDPSTQDIINGIDLSTKGGMIWQKGRSYVGNHVISDTVRGLSGGRSREIYPNLTNAEDVDSSVTAFYNNGFRAGANGATNSNGGLVASWTFRKQPKFFDVVTYSGNAVANRQISHSLGSTPGMVIVKCTSAADSWMVYHRSSGAQGNFLILNSTGAVDTRFSNFWGTTPFSETTFSVSDFNEINGSGRTYVAYLFAHDAGGFGLTGTDNVISCGSYTGNGSATGPVVTLGYEPQWLMIKNASVAGEDWFIVDTMRGFTASTTGGSTVKLSPNTSGVEDSQFYVTPTATGFQVLDSNANVNGSGNTMIYIAIRRGPMKVPTSGTSVFSPISVSNSTGTANTTNFPIDLQFASNSNAVHETQVMDRLRGVITTNTDADSPYSATQSTSAEKTTFTGYSRNWGNTGFATGSSYSGLQMAYWNFRRAPSFFDEVCYTGTGASPQTLTHNLGFVPELMIFKSRSGAYGWTVYSSAIWGTGIGGSSGFDLLGLNSDSAALGNNRQINETQPTASVFSVGYSGVTYNNTNTSGGTYVAYLFATCAGVSKVGSYTGTGTTKQVDCGFTAGARFVLIKRADASGDWYVWDTARGIVAGNDPYVLLNSTAAEVTSTDYIDTYSAGFEISSTAPAAINASGGTFIFLAIA